VQPESAGAVAAAAVGFGALDFGYLSTAGPAIGADLELGHAYPWLFSAGSFAFAAVLPLAGGILGRASPARVLRLGAAVAALGYALLILAPGATAAIAARVVTGAGGAAMLPAALALLGVAGGRGFARSGGAVAGGFAAGALLGGAVAEFAGWRVAAAAVAAPAIALAWRGQARQTLLSRPPGQTPPSSLSLPAGTVRLGAATAGCAAALWLGSVAGVAVGIAAAAGGASGIAAALRAGALPGAVRTGQFCALGFATTASGVGATALLGAALAGDGAGGSARLAAFGLAVPVAVRLASQLPAEACATTGLLFQGGALLGLAVAAPAPIPTLAMLPLVGLGHVLANAGAAALAVGGGERATGPAAGLLGSSQYVGGAIGSLIVFSAAGELATDPAAGLAAAALLAAAGVVLAVTAAARPTVRAAARTPAPR
jgi:MFS family permease